MFNKYLFTIIIVVLYYNAYSQNHDKIHVSYIPNGEILFVVDSQLHTDYGLSYPLTYKIEIPQNSTNLKAFYRTSINYSWERLEEKYSEDFFNGINAVRFEYDSNLAYISTTFSNDTDSLFVKLTNNISNNVFLKFSGVCKYYDNRSAVVCATADDLDKYKINTTFHTAFHEFRKRNLWLSCGAITGRCDNDTWQKIQLQLDSGLVEIDSHSRTHVEAPYPDTESEVGGSKDDIINNLDLPIAYKNKSFEYVYSYLYPYGNYSNTIDRSASDNKYLICRTVVKYQYYYTDWNLEKNLYNRVGEVVELGASLWTDITTLNNEFNNTINKNGIYHMILHPQDIDWGAPYINDHLDYVSNRKNIWYVGFGMMYLYHLMEESVELPISSSLSVKVFLEGAYSNPNSISNLLPNKQPYYQSPFNYIGNEFFNTIPNENIVDWILVSLRANYNSAPLKKRAGFIRSDGYIVDIDGKSPIRFNVSSGSYFIVVEHRNHLAIMSSEPVTID